MRGVRFVTQKVLHSMTGQRTFSVQDAVYMVDKQRLVVCLETITNVSLQAAQSTEKGADDAGTNVVSRYRFRPPKWDHLSLDEFYEVYCQNKFTDPDANKNRMVLPKGLKCKPRFIVDYYYARGMIIMHMSLSVQNPLTNLTIDRANQSTSSNG